MNGILCVETTAADELLTPRGFTRAEQGEVWDRYERGESLNAIGRAFGKPSSSIYSQLAPHGGIRPAPRRRSRLALTLADYRSLFIQARGRLTKSCSTTFAPSARSAALKMPQSTPSGAARSPIWSRFVSVQPRYRIGRYPVTGKGDLIAGSKNTYMATLVERHTRYVMLAKVASRDTETVINALIEQA